MLHVLEDPDECVERKQLLVILSVTNPILHVSGPRSSTGWSIIARMFLGCTERSRRLSLGAFRRKSSRLEDPRENSDQNESINVPFRMTACFQIVKLDN